MNDLNTILLEGKLVRDPELAYTSKEQAYCNFSIAVHRYYRQEEEFKKEVSFFDVVIWGKRAETCAEQLKKGRGVRVCGRLKQERWEDAAGNPNRKVRIIADYVEFKPEFKAKNDPAGTGNDNTEEVQKLSIENGIEYDTGYEPVPEEEVLELVGGTA